MTDDMSKKTKHINDPCSLQIKATFSCEVIHTSMGDHFREVQLVNQYLTKGIGSDVSVYFDV